MFKIPDYKLERGLIFRDYKLARDCSLRTCASFLGAAGQSLLAYSPLSCSNTKLSNVCFWQMHLYIANMTVYHHAIAVPTRDYEHLCQQVNPLASGENYGIEVYEDIAFSH